GVAVVGAKLLYPEELVQHAGVLLNVTGVAGHAHAYYLRDDPGYFGRAVLAQDFMAVTGACMMVRRDIYEALGGLDEENLAVAFNDVDFCLRVREAGHRVVWTPDALLYHHESVSRGAEDTPEKKTRFAREKAYMRHRWGRRVARDPFYNPNLSHERPDFSLSNAPMAPRPWLE
ncbi:MAG TPA: glycosyltransferase family 2 protein, partial [Burkholderiales bacterium]